MFPPLHRKILFAVLVVCTTMLITAGITLAAGSDFIIGDLRLDLSEIYNARDYRVLLLANDRPSTSGGIATGWLGLDLAPYNGQTYSAQFSQVGLYADSSAVYWFVYAEPGPLVCEVRPNSELA